ncbi:MAG: hypothetical protein AUH85_13945 [Chloroflexi bacterium 13_1_40CM_4_68_4]|nr:MAG: hypothetical protein AUH85_13945 [Chloroflexi bacterium 13_1_40CM_4_68_4]
MSALGAAAFLIAFRGQAAASEAASCAPADGFVLSICINVPTSSVRRETTVPLVALPSQRADVRVEVAVPGTDALALTMGVDRNVERVETLFGRTFSARPRIFVFASARSFSTGARDLFDYSQEAADYVANTYGGIFDRTTATIAVNWSASGTQRISAAIAHELTPSRPGLTRASRRWSSRMPRARASRPPTSSSPAAPSPSRARSRSCSSRP